MFRALKERHPAEWQQGRIESSYSKAVLEEDGTVTEIYPFDEVFFHHVDYVLWIVQHELEHFERSRGTWLQGNGLTERVVRTIKFCFKKLALDKGLDYEWDELLWSLVLSYNAAKQQSTGVAPFFTLLFAQEATVPPDLRKQPNLAKRRRRWPQTCYI
ncbi:hypothetical protein CYMTET_51304 [Cymbomonas tetramitiformis]|uniref:Uncharacterized protein n=1 Tax=Cymbomonas tetramitiformis TaxID=36881 RepID=A0AAE0BLC4_9CHLO|nr:hypothetical protein CYMTET_51304 [Cymbomonas tetramitiformis]